MSIKATQWVWEQRDVPLATRAVLLAIADMINRSGEAWPSLSLISSKCEISQRMVQKHLAVAQQLGLINVTRSTGKKSVYSLPTPELYDGVNNMTPLNNMTHTPEQYDRGHPFNRNEPLVNKTRREGTEKNKILQWVEIVNQAAVFCGGQPLTKQHIEIIIEKYSKLDLQDQALAFESFHIEKHNKSKYRTFATYARFSSTWLSRALEPHNGQSQQRVQKNSRGKATSRIPDIGEPSPLL